MKTGLDSVRHCALRPARYANIEGSVELGWGTALVFFALTGYVHLLHPESAWVNTVGWLCLAAAGLAPTIIPKLIKRFITWPRTGYVAYKRDRRFWIMILFTAIFAALLGALLPWLLKSDIEQSVPRPDAVISPGTDSMSGVGVAATALFLGSNAVLYLMITLSRMGEHRWKWCIWVVMIGGAIAITTAVRGNYLEVNRPVTLFLGVVWMFSGGATLLAYLRRSKAERVMSE